MGDYQGNFMSNFALLGWKFRISRAKLVQISSFEVRLSQKQSKLCFFEVENGPFLGL